MGRLSLPVSGKAYCDSNVWVYLIEGIAPYASALSEMLAAADDGSLVLVTSELSLMETLVKPFQVGDRVLSETFERELTSSEQLRIVPIERTILIEAARLRASLSFRTPDAIHLATAAEEKCDVILTNDQRWRSFAPIPVLLLSEAIKAEAS